MKKHCPTCTMGFDVGPPVSKHQTRCPQCQLVFHAISTAPNPVKVWVDEKQAGQLEEGEWIPVLEQKDAQ